MLVTELGLGDYSGVNGVVHNGLKGSHLVTIWTDAEVPVVQARVDNSGNPVGAFRYVSITPLFLGAGDYTIGGFIQEGEVEGCRSYRHFLP